MAKGNGLALERCDLYGSDEPHDPKHDDDCWQVLNFREEGRPVLKDHVPYREAMALVMDIPLEEIEAMAKKFENETPEEEAAWWAALNKD